MEPLWKALHISANVLLTAAKMTVRETPIVNRDIVEVPTLTDTGIVDSVYPFSISQVLTEPNPSPTLITMAGMSHAAIVEAPDASDRAILD